jgi:hypothetical protein
MTSDNRTQQQIDATIAPRRKKDAGIAPAPRLPSGSRIQRRCTCFDCRTCLGDEIAGYVLASAVVAMAMAYWPASAGDILIRLDLVPGRLAAAAVPDRTHKSDRLAISFEQRWSAVPARAAEVRDSKSGRESPRAERRIEKIPFRCELAFSRIISKGNFSTRCIAAIGADARLAAAE